MHNENKAISTNYNSGCRCDTCMQWKREDCARQKARRGPELKALRAEWYGQNKSSIAAREKAWYATPEGRAKKTLTANAGRARKHGYAPISATWQEVMELQQTQLTCEHCGADGPLHTDHCHETGKLRGMLCPSCNSKDKLYGI